MSDDTLQPPNAPESDGADVGGGQALPPATASGDGDRLGRNVATEVVGTVIVMLFGPGLIVLSDGRIGELEAALGFGVGVAVAIGLIGAVANPAFTLALFVVREVSLREAVGDWVGQVIGGIAGGAIIWGINDQTRAAVGASGWDRGELSELGSVMAAELVFGVVVVVVLLAAVGQGFSQAAIAGFTGAAVMVAHLALLGIDGGGLNPARSLGSAIFSDVDPNALGQLWPFVVVPLVAAVAAVFVWLLVDDAEIDDTIFDETFLDDAQNAVTGDAN
ncbi:MAG: aquaporin [Actinomycetota bacterium]